MSFPPSVCEANLTPSFHSISKARTQGGIELEKQAEVQEAEEAADVSDDSDQKSKMSFSYWGADKITVQRPAAKARGAAAATSAIAARRGPVPSAYVSICMMSTITLSVLTYSCYFHSCSPLRMPNSELVYDLRSPVQRPIARTVPVGVVRHPTTTTPLPSVNRQRKLDLLHGAAWATHDQTLHQSPPVSLAARTNSPLLHHLKLGLQGQLVSRLLRRLHRNRATILASRCIVT